MFLKRLLILTHSESELPRASTKCTDGNMSEVSIRTTPADDQLSSTLMMNRFAVLWSLCACSLLTFPQRYFRLILVVFPGRKINECLNCFEWMNLSEWMRNEWMMYKVKTSAFQSTFQMLFCFLTSVWNRVKGNFALLDLIWCSGWFCLMLLHFTAVNFFNMVIKYTHGCVDVCTCVCEPI